MNIAEPDVTLTDYGLALECALFAALLYRSDRGAGPMRTWFIVFFGALAAAALTGGTSHGFFHDESTLIFKVLWNTTLIAIGVTAWSAWMIGSRFEFASGAARPLRWFASALFLGYCIVVLFVRNSFAVAIVHYLPAVLFLLAAFASGYFRSRRRHYLTGLIGLSLTLAAAGAQQTRIALHPEYFDHNALYHLIQAVAVLMLFLSAREIVRHGV